MPKQSYGYRLKFPAMRGGLATRYANIPKIDWTTAYADLYRETSGHEMADAAEVLTDAERRLAIVKVNAQGE